MDGTVLNRRCCINPIEVEWTEAIFTERSRLATCLKTGTTSALGFLRFHTASVVSTCSQLARAAVQVVWGTATQQVSGLRLIADV